MLQKEIGCAKIQIPDTFVESLGMINVEDEYNNVPTIEKNLGVEPTVVSPPKEDTPAQVPKDDDDGVGVVERLLEAVDATISYADTQTNDREKIKIRKRVSVSGVHGSKILLSHFDTVRGRKFRKEIESPEELKTLIASCKDWRYVISANEYSDTYEGVMPDSVMAQAAYVSADELAEAYGEPGLATVSFKRGYQDGKLYLCTVQTMPTDILTIQLCRDEAQTERVHQFFAGKDKKTRLIRSEGDVTIRCGVELKLANSVSTAIKNGGFRPTANHVR